MLYTVKTQVKYKILFWFLAQGHESAGCQAFLFFLFFSLNSFLGGLSLHLSHLIASCMGICYRQFGTLPIGIFLSHLDSRQLDTSLMTSYGHFCHMSTFGDSRAIWVLLPKYRALRKSKFSWWRSDQWSTRLGGFRWADNWATWWYHFLGGATHLRVCWGLLEKKLHFSAHLQCLKGYSGFTDFIKNQSIGVA